MRRFLLQIFSRMVAEVTSWKAKLFVQIVYLAEAGFELRTECSCLFEIPIRGVRSVHALEVASDVRSSDSEES